MIIQTIVTYCPHEGLFVKNVDSFVGNDELEIETEMADSKSPEFEKYWNFLMDSSRIDEVDQLELNLLEGKGYSALVSLACRLAWEIQIVTIEV